MSEIKKGFKGFDRDFKCQNFQFEVGKKFEHDGEIELCKKGFHYCEYPLDVFEYYPPAGSRFAEVEAEGILNKNYSDNKRVAKTLTIRDEISLKAMIEAAIKFTFDRVDWSNAEEKATCYQVAASATGERGAASATGYQGAASATGDRGAASATGYHGAASATGYRGAASATGERGAASATGHHGAASATGERGAASATGDQGAASATGHQGAASATGDRGAASATGDRGAASATGYQGAASATGYQGAASATGYHGAASATGYRGAASATGDRGAAVSLGIEGKAKGMKGSWITLSEWKQDEKDNWQRIDVQTICVDGKKIKADTFYQLKNGTFCEVEK